MAIDLQKIITGERLQALAEITVTTPEMIRYHKSLRRMPVPAYACFEGTHDALRASPESIDRLHGKRSIFVYSNMLDSFVAELLPRLKHSFVLITHNSDVLIDNKYKALLADHRIAHWFAQNALFAHEKLTPLPIGIANAQWRSGKLKKLFEVMTIVRSRRKEVVYNNFKVETNPDIRGPLMAKLRTADMVWTAPKRSFKGYLADMASCRWCISPPGNGIDCHRTWEALYLGVIPIVGRNPAGEELYKGLPVIEVDDLLELDVDEVLTRTRQLQSQTLDYSHLTLDYWHRRISEAVERVGS